MNPSTISYKNHRFPPQIIAHAVWLYFRFPLSLRLVEEMLLERGIIVSYETIRRWGRKFGAAYAKQLRRKKPSREDIWYLDEVVISIGGQKHWLWRAVDQDGYVLDPNGSLCRCGSCGCLQSYVGGYHLARNAETFAGHPVTIDQFIARVASATSA
jgi:hypothetical protein